MTARDERVRELAEQGMSDPAIARELGVSARTILRDRHRLGIGSEWMPTKPPHGTTTRYGAPHGCRCRECTRANSADHRAWREAHKRVTVASDNAGQPWTEAEDKWLTEAPPSSTTAALARQLGRSYDATRKRRDKLRQEAS